jgi:hypothetical protein
MMSMPHCRYTFDSARVENAGPFHAQVRTAPVDGHTVQFASGCFQRVAQHRAHGVSKGDVGHDAFAEEGGFGGSSARPVKKLVGNDDIERLEFLPQ